MGGDLMADHHLDKHRIATHPPCSRASTGQTKADQVADVGSHRPSAAREFVEERLSTGRGGQCEDAPLRTWLYRTGFAMRCWPCYKTAERPAWRGQNLTGWGDECSRHFVLCRSRGITSG